MFRVPKTETFYNKMIGKAGRSGYFVHKCHLSNPYPGSIKEILILTEEGLRE